jgi:hypothetical protein
MNYLSVSDIKQYSGSIPDYGLLVNFILDRIDSRQQVKNLVDRLP